MTTQPQQPNRNLKANTEMEIAQRNLYRARCLVDLAARAIETSHLAFDEAIATSTQKDQPCYQRVTGEFKTVYGDLQDAMAEIRGIFLQPSAARFCDAGKRRVEAEVLSQIFESLGALPDYLEGIE